MILSVPPRPFPRWAAAAAGLALAAASPRLALSQDGAYQAPRSYGGAGARPSPTASRPATTGLSVPPGLVGAAGPNLAPGPTSPTTPGAAWSTASATRSRTSGTRERPPRRSRPPTSAPVQATFRPTIIAPEVTADIQPIQTGLPDPAPPPAFLRRPRPEGDPYAPVGARLGNINLFPVLGQSIGYDSNPNRSKLDRRGSFVSQTEGELGIQSDWSRHDLFGFLRGAYYHYPDNKAADRPEAQGRVRLRLDATRDTEIDIEGRFQIDTQRPGSPDLNVAVAQRPLVITEGASLGGTHRMNRLFATLRGSVDRTDFENARLTDGSTVSQRDRNLTIYGARARVGYELNPGLIPFAEVLGDSRVYDRRIDSSGFARSSHGLGGKVGAIFELTRLITGEISGGAEVRDYQDPRLKSLTSPVADIALAWAMTSLTTLRATASAGVYETTVPNSNGVNFVRGTLTLSHDLRRNVTLTAGLTAAENDYEGVAITERSFGALLRADWRLTRQIALRASYNYETLRSTVAGSSYVTNVFLVGLRLQP